MKKFSKILTVLLAVALVCTGLILAVSADDGYVAEVNGTKYETLSAALDAATEGSTVKLVGDASIAPYNVNKSVTLDLNGYTLSSSPTDTDAKYAFGLLTEGVKFAIVGDGNINIDAMLLYATATVDAKVAGTQGITINHTATIDNCIVSVKTGNYSFSNLDITSDMAGGSGAFYINGAASADFIGVEFNSTQAISGKTAAIYVNPSASVNVAYSSIVTSGAAAFSIPTHSNKNENLLKIDSSYIHIPYKDGNSSIFYNNYGVLGSDIVISNSYCNYSQRMLFKSNANGSALILKNTVFLVNGSSGSNIRSINVKLEEGSCIIGNHSKYATDVQIFSHYDNTGSLTVGDCTKVNMILYEGARFDKAGYDKLMNVSGTKSDGSTGINFYTEGQIVYPDGSTPTNSTSYKLIYDPSNPTAPYVVVPYDADDYSSSSKVFDNDAASYVKGGSGAVVSTYKYGFKSENTATKWTSDVTATGSVPQAIVQSGQNILPSTADVIVFDIEMGTDAVRMANGTFYIHSRANTGTWGSGDRSKSIFTIDANGFATIGDNKIQMDISKMNHVTVVIDTNTVEATGTAYVYINGQLLGTAAAYNGADSYVQSIKYGYSRAADTSVIFDNLCLRTYGDGTATSFANPEKYLVNGGTTAHNYIINSSFEANGRKLPNDINEVITLANEWDFVPQLVRNISGQKVAVNGMISANGYSIEFAEDSYPFRTVLDAEGNIYTYTFNDAWNASLNVKFFFGDVSSAADLADETKYTEAVLCDLGVIPSDLFTGSVALESYIHRDGTHYLHATLAGWTSTLHSEEFDGDDPLSLEFAEAHSGETVVFYPGYTKVQTYTWVVTDAEGNFLRGHNQTNMWGSDWSTRGPQGGTNGDGTYAVKLAYGETFVLQKDIKFCAAFNAAARDASAENKVLNFDLNGHTITFTEKTNGIGTAAAGETLNVYSSLPGAKIIAKSISGGAAKGGVIFFHSNGLGESAEAQNGSTNANTHINVGTLVANGKQYYGSNIELISGDCLLDARATDSSCTFNMKDVDFLHNSQDYGAVILPRYYNGTANFENCNFTMTANTSYNVLLRGHEGTEENPTSAMDGGAFNFNGCEFIMLNNGQDVVGVINNVKSVTFENCVTNGRIAGNKVLLGENVSAYKIEAPAAEGIVVANYNLPMSLASFTQGTVYTTSVQGVNEGATAIVENAYIIAPYGYEGEANLVLPLLAYKTVKAEDALEVTFAGIGNNESTTQLYVNGGQIIETPEILEYVGTAIKLVPTGAYDKEVVTTVTESVVYTPLYEVKATIEGIKANLSLYADFDINLFVPAEYKDVVTVKGLEYTEVTVNGVDYLKVTVSQKCDAAADSVVFNLAVAEGEYVADATVTVSIASYAETILSGEKYTDSDKVLMTYMLAYANAAETYFGGAANETISTLLNTYSEYASKYTVEKNYDEAIANTGLSTVFDYATLDLESSPAFVLGIKEGFAGTVTVSYAKGANVRNYTLTIESGREIKIDGMKVYNFGTILEITAVGTLNGSDVNVSGMYSLDTFAKHHTDNAADAESETRETSIKCLPLIEALHAYAEVAELYKTGALEGIINPSVDA